MIAKIPIIIVAVGRWSIWFFMLKPINVTEIPKNNKLKPTIREISPAENMGNIIKINPKIMDSIPAILLTSMCLPPFS